MARNKQDTQQADNSIQPHQAANVQEMAEAGQIMSLAQEAVMDAEEALKMVGRIEASEFLATVAEKMIAETALALKESKKYKGLPYKDEKGNWKQVSTFEEFCEHKLHKGRRRVDQLIGNYNILGPELYEQAEKIGFRQRDYNALKALPADDRQLIAQAIEEENLDKALDLMQEMAAKHYREKEALTKKTEELTHTLEAKDMVIKDKSAKIDEQAEKLAGLENRQRIEQSRPVSAEQRLIDARNNLQITAANIKASVMASLRKNIKDLHELDGDHSAFAAGLLIEIVRELHILRDEYNLPTAVSEDLTPEWMREGWEDSLENQFLGLPSVSDLISDEA